MTTTTMKVCRVCLSMSRKMYHMSEHKMSVAYELVTGVVVNTEDQLPKMLCWECVARLSSANSFRKKALKTHLMLVDKMKSSRFLSIGDVESIDKAQLESSLGVKVHRENFCNVHVIEESNNIADEEQISVADNEKDPIKLEYLGTEEDEELKEDCNEMKFVNVDFKVEPVEVIKSEFASDEMMIEYEGCAHHSEEWNDCKDLKVMMPTPMEHNVQGQSIEGDDIFNRSIKNEDGVKTPIKYINIICKGSTSQVTISSEPGTSPTKRRRTPKNIDHHCKHCDFATTIRSRLKYHMNTKHPKNSFNCDHCDFTTTIKASLIGHINAKHTKNIIYSCSYCSYKTHIRPNLNAHTNTKHTKNNTFDCSYCSYTTTIKPNLIMHINNKHTKVNSYKCSFCNYKVYNKLSLNRHVNAKHTRAQVFHCSYCSFTTFRRCRLNTHVHAKHPDLMTFSDGTHG